MFEQIYNLHLIDGSVVSLSEDYDLSGENAFINRFIKSEPEHVFCIGDEISGFTYVPKRSIVYVTTGDVDEVNDLGS